MTNSINSLKFSILQVIKCLTEATLHTITELLQYTIHINS